MAEQFLYSRRPVGLSKSWDIVCMQIAKSGSTSSRHGGVGTWATGRRFRQLAAGEDAGQALGR
jgi:hypothetical protein